MKGVACNPPNRTQKFPVLGECQRDKRAVDGKSRWTRKEVAGNARALCPAARGTPPVAGLREAEVLSRRLDVGDAGDAGDVVDPENGRN